MTTKVKRKPLRYFYFEGNLCKKIHINRGADVITFWDYPDGKLKKASYILVKRQGEKAFSTKEVATMINRSAKTIKEAISLGHIRAPQRTYGLDENKNGYAYYWSEKDIMDLHAYCITVHHGRPRNDGRVTPVGIPAPSELRAMIRQGTVFYVKDASGEFRPTWDANNF